jgi:hypothetical protein
MTYRASIATPAGIAVLAALASAPLALTACGSHPSAAPGSSSPPAATATASPAPSTAVQACGTAQLRIRLIRTGALSGQAGGYLEFTNRGSASCRMSGWPTVTGLSRSGAATVLGRAHATMFGAWTYRPPLPVLTLRPGGSAYAVVAADDQPAGTAPACPAPDVRLRVSPPGTAASITLSGWLPGARSFLPACRSASGTPTGETSAVVPLSRLAH